MGRHSHPAIRVYLTPAVRPVSRGRRVRNAVRANAVEACRALWVTVLVLTAAGAVAHVATRLREAGERDAALAATIVGLGAIAYMLVDWGIKAWRSTR
jgi:hypothetical protein